MDVSSCFSSSCRAAFIHVIHATDDPFSFYSTSYSFKHINSSDNKPLPSVSFSVQMREVHSLAEFYLLYFATSYGNIANIILPVYDYLCMVRGIS